MYWYKNQHDILVYRRQINVKDISDKILPVNVELMPVNSETEGHFYFYFEEPCSPFPSGLLQIFRTLTVVEWKDYHFLVVATVSDL